jgi:hypothetical protein
VAQDVGDRQVALMIEARQPPGEEQSQYRLVAFFYLLSVIHIVPPKNKAARQSSCRAAGLVRKRKTA